MNNVPPRPPAGPGPLAGSGPLVAPATPPFTLRAVVLVFVGGALGVTASTLVRAALAPSISTPLALALVNILGAFALGVLAGWIPDGNADARVLWGTGFLGGFTSFSAIAVTVFPISQAIHKDLGNDPSQASSYEGLLQLELPQCAIALAVFSLLAGMCAAWAGLRLATPRAQQSPLNSRGYRGV